MQKTNNFLNNQRYILGEKEKKKLLNIFFVNKNIKIFKKYLKNIHDLQSSKYFLVPYMLIICLVLIIVGTTYTQDTLFIIFILFFVIILFLSDSSSKQYNYGDNLFFVKSIKILIIKFIVIVVLLEIFLYEKNYNYIIFPISLFLAFFNLINLSIIVAKIPTIIYEIFIFNFYSINDFTIIKTVRKQNNLFNDYYEITKK